MKRLFDYAGVYSEDVGREPVLELARLTGLPVNENEYAGTVSMYPKLVEGSEQHQRFLEAMAAVGLEARCCGVEEEWSEVEILSSRVLRIFFRKEAGPRYDGRDSQDSLATQFNPSRACPGCLWNEHQVTDLVIDIKYMGKADVGLTHQYDVIVSQKFKDLAEAEGLTGARFRRARDYKGRDDRFPPYYQLLSTNILPPMDPTQPFHRDQQCMTCGSGLFLKYGHRYHLKDLKRVEDFNWTAERFGGGWGIGRRFIVTPRVYQFLKAHPLRGKVDFWVVQVD